MYSFITVDNTKEYNIQRINYLKVILFSLILEEYFIIRLNQPSSDKGLDGNSGNVFSVPYQGVGRKGVVFRKERLFKLSRDYLNFI